VALESLGGLLIQKYPLTKQLNYSLSQSLKTQFGTSSSSYYHALAHSDLV
jgi:hypothetical protein